jgi:hypothetical protein
LSHDKRQGPSGSDLATDGPRGSESENNLHG